MALGSVGTWLAACAVALGAQGCGLILDLDPDDRDAGRDVDPGLDAGPGRDASADAGGLDASGVDADRPDGSVGRRPVA